MPQPTYSADALTTFADQLLQAVGLSADKAGAVAAILVEGDLMGHHTHGLALLGAYLAELESGTMTRDGNPEVLADAPAAVTWDGRRLPGPWLVLRAMELAAERAARCGTGTVVIRQSHHVDKHRDDDPRAFAGLDAFTRQTDEIMRQCHASRPAQPGAPVRTPGERCLALAKQHREAGAKLYPSILATLAPWSAKLGVAMPATQG